MGFLSLRMLSPYVFFFHSPVTLTFLHFLIGFFSERFASRDLHPSHFNTQYFASADATTNVDMMIAVMMTDVGMTTDGD